MKRNPAPQHRRPEVRRPPSSALRVATLSRRASHHCSARLWCRHARHSRRGYPVPPLPTRLTTSRPASQDRAAPAGRQAAQHLHVRDREYVLARQQPDGAAPPPCWTESATATARPRTSSSPSGSGRRASEWCGANATKCRWPSGLCGAAAFASITTPTARSACPEDAAAASAPGGQGFRAQFEPVGRIQGEKRSHSSITVMPSITLSTAIVNCDSQPVATRLTRLATASMSASRRRPSRSSSAPLGETGLARTPGRTAGRPARPPCGAGQCSGPMPSAAAAAKLPLSVMGPEA